MTLNRQLSCLDCPTGTEMAPFGGEPFAIDYGGTESRVENLSGWRCGTCGEVLFDPESATRYAAAGDALVLAARDRQGN
jgi:HTH-type transcriptional regulator/antitoxin MqsA